VPRRFFIPDFVDQEMRCSMLVVSGVSKRYGHQKILEKVNFSVNAGECVGLIGPNGCGKTTLIRIIAGEEQSDEGTISFIKKNASIGVLNQNLDLPTEISMGEVLYPQSNQLERIEAEIRGVTQDMASAKEGRYRQLERRYDELLQRLVEASTKMQYRETSSILESLGLKDLPLSTPISEFSGGQKTRLGLALVLLKNPELLLLDEPTNHLDVAMLEWLENWLNKFDGAVLLVSHDRTFLDRTVNRVLDLDPQTHTIKAYAGTYSDYLDQYQMEMERQEAAYRDQVYEIRRVKQDVARLREQARQVERGTIDSSQRRYAKKVAKKASSRQKKLSRYIESEDRVEKPKESWRMKLDFKAPSKHGRNVLICKDLAIGYPSRECLLEKVNIEVLYGARIAITGPNGAGKTTLLRTIANELKPLEGQLWLSTSVRVGYMTQEQEFLDPDQNALEAIRQVVAMNETEARSFLHYFLFTEDDPLRPVGELSFGERARLQLAFLVGKGCDFLLLDEPINHLDIPSRTSFEKALATLTGTVLAVVHDRYFIERFATEVWTVDNRGVVREYLQPV
jgi:ATP-binding cassette subfamily F protein 3